MRRPAGSGGAEVQLRAVRLRVADELRKGVGPKILARIQYHRLLARSAERSEVSHLDYLPLIHMQMLVRHQAAMPVSSKLAVNCLAGDFRRHCASVCIVVAAGP